MARYEATNLDMIETAALDGAPDALYELGLNYCNGRGVPIDLIEAHKWLSLSAARGNAAARSLRAELSEEMTRADIGLAQRRAREWLSKH